MKSYQFILKSDKNYEKHLQDPDAFIEWDNIQQVVGFTIIIFYYYYYYYKY